MTDSTIHNITIIGNEKLSVTKVRPTNRRFLQVFEMTADNLLVAMHELSKPAGRLLLHIIDTRDTATNIGQAPDGMDKSLKSKLIKEIKSRGLIHKVNADASRLCQMCGMDLPKNSYMINPAYLGTFGNLEEFVLELWQSLDNKTKIYKRQ